MGWRLRSDGPERAALRRARETGLGRALGNRARRSSRQAEGRCREAGRGQHTGRCATRGDVQRNEYGGGWHAERVPAPASADLRILEAEVRRLHLELAAVRIELDALREEVARLLVLKGMAPPRQDPRDHRKRRIATWRLFRLAWQHGRVLDEAAAERVQQRRRSPATVEELEERIGALERELVPRILVPTPGLN